MEDKSTRKVGENGNRKRPSSNIKHMDINVVTIQNEKIKSQEWLYELLNTNRNKKEKVICKWECKISRRKGVNIDAGFNKCFEKVSTGKNGWNKKE